MALWALCASMSFERDIKESLVTYHSSSERLDLFQGGIQSTHSNSQVQEYGKFIGCVEKIQKKWRSSNTAILRRSADSTASFGAAKE